jgi:hypothetical protein
MKYAVFLIEKSFEPALYEVFGGEWEKRGVSEAAFLCQ